MKISITFTRYLLLAVTVLAGCSSLNPYQRSARVDLPLQQLAHDARTTLARDTGVQYDKTDVLAGNLDGALAAVKDQRSEWYESLSSQARVRAITQLTIIGVSASAIYNSLKSGTASSGDAKRLALAGAIGATAYAASDWQRNPQQEEGYVQGMRKLTCNMLLIEPLRMTQVDYVAFTTALATLNSVVTSLDKELLIADATYRYDKDDETPAAQVRQEASAALSRARFTLQSGRQLAREIELSGVTLMRESDLVFAEVASTIRTANKATPSPDQTGTTLSGLITKFRSIGGSVTDEGSKTSTVSNKGSDTTKTVSGSNAPVTSTVASTTSTTSTTTTVPAKTTATTSLASATTQQLIDQLTASLRKEFDKALAGTQGRLQKQVDAAKAAADLAKASAGVSTAAAAQGLAACKSTGREDCELTADKTSVSLAAGTAALYAARRPVSMQLTTFYAARTAAEKNRACTGPGSAMAVFPSADAVVQPDTSYQITVTGVPQPPTVKVTGGKASIELLYGSTPTTTIVRVLVPADAKGDIELSISDRGLATEDIKLTVADKK